MNIEIGEFCNSSEKKILVLLIFVITFKIFLLRMAGLNPNALWLDDQWVGVVVKNFSLNFFLECLPPVPIGFAYICHLFYQLIPDPELALQVFPFLVGVVQVPLFAFLVVRLSVNKWLPVLAASLFAINQDFAIYTVRAKQYTLDSLITILLLLAMIHVLKTRKVYYQYILVATALVAQLFSFPSVFISVPVIAICLIGQCKVKPIQKGYFGPSLLYVLGMFCTYLLLFKDTGNASMSTYWSEGFLSFDSWASLQGFVSYSLVPVLRGGFVSPVVILLVFCGAVHLVFNKQYLLALFLPLSLSLYLAASYLHIYPMRSGRLAMFYFPVVFTYSIFGIDFFLKRLSFNLHYVFVVIAVIVTFFGIRSSYPMVTIQKSIVALEQEMKPDDGLIIHPFAGMPLAFYSKMKSEVVPDEWFATNFKTKLLRSNTLQLDSNSVDFRLNPGYAVSQIKEFAQNDYKRIFLLLGKTDPRYAPALIQAVSDQGYLMKAHIGKKDGYLLLFEH